MAMNIPTALADISACRLGADIFPVCGTPYRSIFNCRILACEGPHGLKVITERSAVLALKRGGILAQEVSGR